MAWFAAAWSGLCLVSTLQRVIPLQGLLLFQPRPRQTTASGSFCLRSQFAISSGSGTAVSIELVPLVSPHRRRVRVYFGAKVTKSHERFGPARVLKRHAGFRAVFGAEVFVLGQVVKADELRAVQRLAVDGAFALHTDQPISALVFHGAFLAGFDRQFLRGEVLETVDFAIDDPAIHETFVARVGDGHRFEVV